MVFFQPCLLSGRKCPKTFYYGLFSPDDEIKRYFRSRLRNFLFADHEGDINVFDEQKFSEKTSLHDGVFQKITMSLSCLYSSAHSLFPFFSLCQAKERIYPVAGEKRVLF